VTIDEVGRTAVCCSYTHRS